VGTFNGGTFNIVSKLLEQNWSSLVKEPENKLESIKILSVIKSNEKLWEVETQFKKGDSVLSLDSWDF